MAHVVEEAKPHVWTEAEARQSGKGGYRIGVELFGNPFKGSLAECWIEGYKEAAASDTTSKKRVDYSQEDRYDRRPRFDNRRPSTDVSRPRTKGFPLRNGGGRNPREGSR